MKPSSDTSSPITLSLYGRLPGTPLPDGSYSVVFRLYSTSQGGQPLWSETNEASLQGGILSVLLGKTAPFPTDLAFEETRYLSVQVGLEAERAPRLSLQSWPDVPVLPGWAITEPSDPLSYLEGEWGASPLSSGGTAGAMSMAPTVGGVFWGLSGNRGTNSTRHFLGTYDSQPLVIKTNSTEAVRIGTDQAVTLAQSLTLNGDLKSSASSLSLWANGVLGLRVEGNGTSPNLIGGYSGNSVTSGARGAFIGGGGSSSFVNTVTDDYGVVGGGIGNRAGDNAGTTTDRAYATVGGGLTNTASGAVSTIGGGSTNTASAGYSTVGGGLTNTASGGYSAVGGGLFNTASGDNSAVGGGNSNIASGVESSISGGYSNKVTDDYGTVGGGLSNQAGTNDGDTTDDVYATVGGGRSNTASGSYSTVGGGQTNTASGSWSTVGGGISNIASGDYSFAAGSRAKATLQGSFVWGDSNNFNITSSAANEFTARATGGFRLITGINSTTGDPNAGVTLGAGSGTWSSMSDRNMKHRFTSLDPQQVLLKLNEIPITQWSYKAQGEVRHVGPTAQDFYRSFGLGLGETTIDTVDADGIALLSIQGLYRSHLAQKTLIEKQQKEIANLKNRNAEMEARLERLERLILQGKTEK